MSISFRGGRQLAGVVLGLISGQVEERLFERRPLDGELVEGYAVGGRHPADLGRAQAGNDQGAVGTELDGGAPQGQGVGQFSRLQRPGPDGGRAECPLTKSSVLASAMMRPLPMTSRWSAVWAISLMRWLDRNTVRPSAASDFMRLRIPRCRRGRGR